MFGLSVSSLSTVYIQVPVAATFAGVAHDPTGDPIQMAFMTGTTKPSLSDWKTGSWDTAPGPVYLAQVLIGPGSSIVLGVGVYTVWLKITDSPEIPVDNVGYLTIE